MYLLPLFCRVYVLYVLNYYTLIFALMNMIQDQDAGGKCGGTTNIIMVSVSLNVCQLIYVSTQQL